MEFLLENLEVLFTLRDKPQAPLYRIPRVVPLGIHKASLFHRKSYTEERLAGYYTHGNYSYR